MKATLVLYKLQSKNQDGSSTSNVIKHLMQASELCGDLLFHIYVQLYMYKLQYIVHTLDMNNYQLGIHFIYKNYNNFMYM